VPSSSTGETVITAVPTINPGPMFEKGASAIARKL
jgi:hypothetical protein